MTSPQFSIDGIPFIQFGEIMLLSSNYNVSPNITTNFVALPGYEGGIVPQQQVQSGLIEFDVVFNKPTAAALRASLDAWNTLVGPYTGNHKVVIDEWPDRYYKGKFLGMPQVQIYTATIWGVAIQLSTYTTAYSLDVYGYPNPPGAMTTLTAASQSFEVQNSGSAVAYPQWVYVASGTEPITIANNTTNETVTYNVVNTANARTDFIAEPYADDESQPWVCMYNGLINMIPMTGAIPRLAPGGNSVTVTGAVGGKFAVYWRNRYY